MLELLAYLRNCHVSLMSLQLLQRFYGSESDDTDPDDGADVAEPDAKRQRPGNDSSAPAPLLPALPHEVTGHTSAAETEDPYLGRLRTLPLLPGEFACSVHIPLPPPPQHAWRAACAFITAVRTRFPALKPLHGGDTSPAQLHVSLSRPFAMRHAPAQHAARVLVKELQRATPQLPRGFSITARPVALTNENRTRTFLALLLDDTCLPGVAAADAATDAALRRHGVDPHLGPDQGALRPHISIAWAPGDVSTPLQAAADAVASSGGTLPWDAPVTCVHLVVGHKIAVVWGPGTAKEMR